MPALAGGESHGRHALAEDFATLGQKMEKIGFAYYRDRVIVINPEVEMTCVG